MRRNIPILAIICFSVVAVTVVATQQCRADQPTGSAAAAVSTSDDVVARFEKSKYAWQQLEVARELVTRGDLTILPRMELLAKTDNRQRRCNAAFVLDGLGDPRGLAILLAELKDQEPRTPLPPDELRGNGGMQQQITADRYYAAVLLGHIGRDEAVPALVDALQVEQLSTGAAFSLGNLGNRSAIPELIEMAEKFPQNRDSAGAALAALGDQRGLDMLTQLATHGHHWVVQEGALVAIATHGSVAQQDVLLKAIRDPHPNVRVAAVRALKNVGSKDAVPALQALLQDHEPTPAHAPTTVSKEAEKAISMIEERAGKDKAQRSRR
jgi:HEAT repeat protein